MENICELRGDFCSKGPSGCGCWGEARRAQSQGPGAWLGACKMPRKCGV